MNKTSIQWTDTTWNPVRGCSRVSEGCRNCYAETMAARFSDKGMAYEGLATRHPARWTGKVRLIEEHLEDPLKWRAPRRVFVNSMSDLFHESLTITHQTDIFEVMAKCPQHTFQILTKRADQLYRMKQIGVGVAYRLGKESVPNFWPLPNVWLGVSAEDQKTFAERWDYLRHVPAAVRFISMEPLLGSIDMQSELWEDLESGPNARPCDISNIRSIVEQCKAASVPCFVKQLGSVPVWNGCGLVANNPKCLTSQSMDDSRLIQLHPSDRKGGDPSEWPEDLRIREFPRSRP
jgi:protein gp37